MKIPWKTVLHFGVTALGAIVPGVAEAEALAESLPGLHGREKEDRVVELVKAALVAQHGITGKQLAQDGDVDAATRGVIQAVVGLHNIVAHKVAAPTT